MANLSKKYIVAKVDVGKAWVNMPNVAIDLIGMCLADGLVMESRIEISISMEILNFDDKKNVNGYIEADKIFKKFLTYLYTRRWAVAF